MVVVVPSFLLSGRGMGSRSRELRASRGVRVSRSLLSFSVEKRKMSVQSVHNVKK